MGTTVLKPFAFETRVACEMSLTVREERRLRVFENRVLTRIFGPKGCGKLHNEELNDLYSSPNIVRVMKSRRVRWGACSAYRGGERLVQGFCGET
jgi:hypothetical protein